MSSLPKLAVVSLAIIAIGALQFVMPAFSNNPNTALNASTKVLAPDSSLSNLPVKDFHSAQSGTLYFINEQVIQDETVQQHSLSPVLKTKVDIKVTGIVARTKLTQTFRNAGTEWVSALYVFPLPENAAVDHLLMTIGDRKIEGVITEKDEAKKRYLQAKAEGKKVSLIAQQRPNIFSNRIANIGPGETIEVSIEYQQRIPFEQQQYSLRFPLTITPRYQPKGTTEASQIQPNFSQNHSPETNNIELQVHLQAGFSVQNISSEFHPIKINPLPDGSQHIQLVKNSQANQDFVLNWQPELGAAPQSAHFTQLVNGDKYGLIMLLPPHKKQHSQLSQNREVIFVLDTSGSMEGDSIQQAKQALLLAIDELKPKDRFNIIEFNNYAQHIWKSPKPADLNNKQQAKHFVNSLSANGGTEMQSALQLAFAQPKGQLSTGLRQIIFITDGSVANEASLMTLINKKLGDSRLFTVGIGSAPNSYFMTEAAKMGRGTFTYIGSVEQVQQKMLGLLSKLQHPAVTDIELQLNDYPLQSDPQLEFYPNIISDLYKGEPLVLSYKISGSNLADNFSNVNIKAQFQQKPWGSPLVINGETRQSGLNVLWARQKIGQLTRDKRRAGHAVNSSDAEQQTYKHLITETALAHHMVSQYTSLVAVDVTPTRPLALPVKEQKLLNPMPKGALYRSASIQGQLPQTSTTAQLRITIGLILMGLALCMHLLTRKIILSQN
ncbi:marine proteobacterial sortase target protein [uncultured Paraglaciecola sp.]|uniref:marine proteobacterial sortase target protein n=1 Tax=uncultured Paraglaciecola sp. TaxID=1765024 RepID=UPI00263577A8|nr:marine proteobacterial sortase target protein [uncultured Paraglaciecola sp.]